MKHHIQTLQLGLAILMLLTAFPMNADTPKINTSEVNYNYYTYPGVFYDLDSLNFLKKYHRFLPSPAPGELYYHTRLITTANIDDTPEKEDVALIVIDTKHREAFGNWSQAFLLIANTEAQKIKKKAFFKLFDTGTYTLDVPSAKPIELHSPPFAFTRPSNVSFRLADLTDDGILDVWVESAHGVALISFENGEFGEVFTNHTVTRKTLAETPEVEYYGYNRSDPEGQKYHRFLPSPAPKALYYNTRDVVAANIDDTPEKERIVLMTAEIEPEAPPSERESVQAFLLIAEDTPDMMKKKAFFKIFNVGTDAFDVPGKTIAVQSAPFVFREVGHSNPWSSGHVSFELVDLTGDGILDIWMESYEGLVVVSFQNGEFVEVCSAYSSIRREDPIEYINLDSDGIYEIKIPDRISIDRVPTASYPHWMSLYEWDGNTYVLHNERFYADNDAFLIQLLEDYNHVLFHYGRYEEYSFYIGLVYFYRGNAALASAHLQWVVENAEKQDYIHAAEDLLKKLSPTELEK